MSPKNKVCICEPFFHRALALFRDCNADTGTIGYDVSVTDVEGLVGS